MENLGFDVKQDLHCTSAVTLCILLNKYIYITYDTCNLSVANNAIRRLCL
jgi:hypothetical protein